MQVASRNNKEIQLGIMIETPAAAMISDDLAKEVDFFSVGTNDLTQYTTAVDRQNANLEGFYYPHHKGLLRLIKWQQTMHIRTASGLVSAENSGQIWR